MATYELSNPPTTHALLGGRLEGITRWLGWLLIPLGLLSLWAALLYAPAEETMGDVYRIFFYHLPANIGGFVLFFIAFAVGIAYLRTRNPKWDQWGLASIEVGIVAAFIGTVTGSIWARPVWNTWWTWDPRLTTVTILLLTYAGYLMLRGAVDDPERRARFSAIYAILAFVNVPLVYFSTRIVERTVHPVVFGGDNAEAMGDMSLTPAMNTALMICMVFGILLLIWMVFRRVQLAQREAEVEQMRWQMMEAPPNG
ncbi:MAG: cytochrome c biogenesis protein CcsA [Anaerolineales bacterium]|nr:cytochrome c biogenesis protein CcsA [Anaerolineales bacterium]MCB9127883.1 cytochrome c biogenesis protein CcsA [Ardenticatenales bacterium]MCB9171645.1 cytochrome c biogenesis protein CcsA [Ardenticatenales bacterium]